MFYFVVSLLLAAVFSYVIFLAKNAMQRQEIEEKTAAVEEAGTAQQKEHETEVIFYQKKIRDFIGIFENHEFASSVFSFMQSQTLPNIWFSRFNLDKKNSKVQLLGEAENMEDLSMQVAIFEKNEYVVSVTALNSSLADSARVQFNINLVLDPKLFEHAPEIPLEVSDIGPVGLTSAGAVTELSGVIFHQEETGKIITLFDFPLKPEVVGRINQANLTIELDVPFGTDITKLVPIIIASPGAVVSPRSNIAQNFSSPIVYKVTAQDGSSQDYTVKVNVLPKAGKSEGKFSAGLIFIIGFALAVIFAGLAGLFAFRKKQIAKFKIKNEN